MKLFPDQEQVVDDLYALIDDGAKKIVLQAATGAGKTVLASHVMRDVWEADGRVLFLVHLDQLVIQTAEKLIAYGLPADQIGYITGGRKPQYDRPIQIGSVQTLARRKEVLGFYQWDCCILDEMHVTAWATACAPLFEPPMAEQLVIGLSATPIRLKKTEGPGDKFTHMVKAPPVHDLMEQGRLCRLRYYGFNVGAIDTAGVKTQAGDFKTDELEQACDRPELLDHAVGQWKRLAHGRRTLAFGVTVKHAQDLAGAFNAAGVAAATVTGETPRDERQEIYRQLEAKEILVVTSVNVLSIGFDSPLGGECLLLCRPTKSLAVHLQQLGRGARVHPDKDGCLVLDQAGNCLKHGPLEADNPWDLRKGEEPEGPGGAGFPMKQCPECGFLMPAQVRICPECQAEQPVKEKQIRTDALVELVFDKAERRQRSQLQRWILKAMSNGYLQGWVAKQYEQKFGTLPRAEMWRGTVYGPSPRPQDGAHYMAAWGQICRRKNRTWTVALTALTREFDPDYLDTQDLGALRQAWEETYAAQRVI